MAARLSQVHAKILKDLVHCYGCGTSTGRPQQQHQSKNMLRRARPRDRKPLVNGLEPVKGMPMSLVVDTA